MHDRTIRHLSRAAEYRRVVIREVNLPKRVITGEQATGERVRINFDFLEPVLVVPSPGEMWVIKRFENEWRLDRRMENGDEDTPISDLEPGDTRIENTHIVYINGQQVIINGIPYPPENIRSLNVVIESGNTNPISTGLKGWAIVDFNCRIKQWMLVADAIGDIEIDVWKTNYEDFPGDILSSIVAEAPPFLSMMEKNLGTILPDWTTDLSAGDILTFNVNSINGISKMTLDLKLETIFERDS